MTQVSRFIRRRELCTITGRSISSLYRDVAAGRLPKPYQIGPRAVGWREDELQDFLQALPQVGHDQPLLTPAQKRTR